MAGGRVKSRVPVPRGSLEEIKEIINGLDSDTMLVPRQRRIATDYLYHFVGGLSIYDISKKLGVPIATVKQDLRRINDQDLSEDDLVKRGVRFIPEYLRIMRFKHERLMAHANAMRGVDPHEYRSAIMDSAEIYDKLADFMRRCGILETAAVKLSVRTEPNTDDIRRMAVAFGHDPDDFLIAYQEAQHAIATTITARAEVSAG